MAGIVITLCVAGFLIGAIWQVFEKAGQPGWASLVPIYNMYILTKVAKLSGFYTVLCIVPLINLFALWKIYSGVAKSFGKGTGFSLGMFFLTPIFISILGYGDDKYQVDAPPPVRPQKVA